MNLFTLLSDIAVIYCETAGRNPQKYRNQMS